MVINLNTILIIFLGGGLGSVGRYLLSGWMLSRFSNGFPYGTLVVNILGCFAIGWIWAWLSDKGEIWLYLLLIVGFLGGFTTFSTFGLDALSLFQQNKTKELLYYVLLSNILGILAVFAGNRLQQIIMKMI